ncbi:MAG: OmpA family protein [Planctomycetota bacterium]|nr:OmpA family protein [Planctomycetota bacterium]
MIRRGGIVTSLLLLGGAVLLGGCNKSGKQIELAQQEAAELREKNAALEAQLGERNTRIADLEGRLAAATAAPPPVDTGWERPASGRSSRTSDGGGSFDRSGRATISGDVLFDSGQVTIKSSARSQLDRIAADIQRQYGDADVRVEGYTDTDPIRKSKWGSNEALSQARADAVRDYLIRKGVSSSRISSVGMGSASPKATKAASRRVEVVILR